MKTTNMKTKPKLVRRRAMGLWLMASGKAIPAARVVYEADYYDGKVLTTKMEWGNAVYGIDSVDRTGLNKKQKRVLDLQRRPDLFVVLQAASLLNSELVGACCKLDQELGMKEL